MVPQRWRLLGSASTAHSVAGCWRASRRRCLWGVGQAHDSRHAIPAWSAEEGWVRSSCSLYWIHIVTNGCSSWPVKFHEAERTPKQSFYDKIHPTWVATQALRDRDFKIERVGNAKWAKWIVRVVQDTEFSTLLYKPAWKSWFKKQRAL